MELVSTVTGDGVRLDGALARSDAPARGVLPVDLFICHHGVGNNFYDRRFYGPLRTLLLAAGCDVLCVNNRGHDLVYSQPVADSVALRRTQGRLGSAYEILDDCRHDWSAWTEFAVAAGYERIGLWGHSLGAVKTIYFLAKVPQARVRCAIASSPPRFSHQGMLASPQGSEFRAAFGRAQAHTEAGEHDALMSVTVPALNLFSAGTFVDKYGREDRYDFFELLPAVRTPLLVTLGGAEREGTFRSLAQKGTSLASEFKELAFELVPGADHYYSGHAAELWNAARNWLARFGSTPPGGPLDLEA